MWFVKQTDQVQVSRDWICCKGLAYHLYGSACLPTDLPKVQIGLHGESRVNLLYGLDEEQYFTVS